MGDSHSPKQSSGKSCQARPFKVLWWPRILLGYLVLLLSFRFGEAAHPGPVVGTVNPTGLLGKAALFQQLPQGIYGICESHLSAAGLHQFRRELAIHGSQMRYFSSSNAPLIRNTIGVIGGKSTGVGFLASYPGRNIPTTWDDAILTEARTHVSAFNIDNVWVKCGVCYGYAKHPTTIATRSNTDNLLAKVVERIVFECNGPRIVMGDWNQLPGQLPQEQILRQQGFVEVQQHIASLWGRPPTFTCKKTSVKDFLWISPELIPFLTDVSVNQDLFPDHVVLTAHFSSFGNFQPVPVWRRPAPLPWDHLQGPFDPQTEVKIDPADLQASLSSVMNQVEQDVHCNLLAQDKPGLQPIHRGRSCTLSPTLCRHPVPPNKKARNKEINPTYMGEHFQHVQWLRQLRRLQSLVALLTSQQTSMHHLEHRTTLWKAILHAPGFSPSFSKFWITRSIFIPNAPCALPYAMPELHIVTSVFVTFKLEFTQFEQALRNKRACIGKENRVSNPLKVFNDVAMPRALSVQTVARHNHYTITEVSEDGLHCVVSPAGLLPDSPLISSQGPLPTTAIRDSSFDLSKPDDLQIGHSISQKVHLGTRSEVLTEFENLWMQYWGRHENTDPNRWQPFIDMCSTVLPPPPAPMPCQPITPCSWKRALQRRKATSATGPDGISRQDLINMGSQHVDHLLQILQCVEAGSKWPESCLIGLITSLAKKESSEFVHEFRPICVFSQIYRTWSSIRAREILRYLSSRAPAELIGNRPRHETADVWWSIACQVEASYQGGPPLAGAIADITKCFNALPRTPLFALAKLLQLPSQLCEAWCQALTGMQRRFVVEGGVGQALLTTNGYPEGDPLSVCAMFLVNLALHAFSFSCTPEVCIWTFVDDWQLTGNSSEDVMVGMQVVRQFTEMLDLTLDDQKSFFWGTTASIRKHFRDMAKTVKLHLRNLGGHVSYSRMATNHTVTNRIFQGTLFWHWMRRSLAPIDQKIRLLPVVAWPRFLHGSSGVHIGDEHFRKLRSKAMQSLAFDRKGANPLLQFGGVLHPRNDPAFHVLTCTIRAFRRFCVPDIAFPILNALACSDKPLRGPGPCEVFLARLHTIGWAWLGDGTLQDHSGFAIHILHSPIQLVYQRLLNAWEFKVGSTVSHREGFQGLEHMSFHLTWGRNKWDAEALGLLRVVLNGTFFTRNKQFATGKVPSVDCPYCKVCEDSSIHRHFGCQFFQPIRESLPREFFRALDDLPECCLQHGWMCYPKSLHAFQEALVQMPDLTHSFCGDLGLTHSGPLHLFTDGSCAFPAEPLRRLASWGFCAADLSSGDFVPIAQGPVWGLVQTVLRGELIACISAYQFALGRQQCFWIWTDSQTVWDFLDGITMESSYSNQMWTDHDLKSRLGALHVEATKRNLLVRSLSHELLPFL